MNSHPSDSSGPSAEEPVGAAQRSHRALGEALDLFHFPAHSPGSACWHPRGLRVYRAIEALICDRYERHGYQQVRTPLLCTNDLWAQSGHLGKFAGKMITAQLAGRAGALKPMNCPGHAEYFAQRPRSHRELPLRVAELGHVHRAERSGELNGLLRARSFVIDDAHIFSRPEQVAEELAGCLALAVEIYELFGMEVSADLSLRPEMRLGSDAMWERAEQGLRSALERARLRYAEFPGEGAFYGPKVDLHVHDRLGRRWQMGTVQLDYQLPERFGLTYVDEHGGQQRPVIVHRALLGSLERFIAIVLEHTDGWLPLWLAPEPLRVLPVSAKQDGEALALTVALSNGGVCTGVDADGPLGGRVRRAHEQRVPLLGVIGAREAAAGQVSLRARDGERLVSRDELIAGLGAQVAIPRG